MKIKPNGFPLPLSESLVGVLNKELRLAEIDPQLGVTLNFRDPHYAVEAGGYHPVEISIDPTGQILYVTDFSYVGRPPFEELVKELDFDASLGLFQQFSREYPLSAGRELFAIWQENFVSYYVMKVFQVTVSEG